MDAAVLWDAMPLFAQAAWLTTRIGVLGVLLSLVIGLFVAATMHFKIPVLRQLARVYVELSRNTPLLVQLFFLYYALPKVTFNFGGIEHKLLLSSEQCAIIGLAFLGGSYMAEVLRSGLEAVDPIQRQSAVALGLSGTQTLVHVLLPQAFANALPGLTANTIFLIKETSMVSIIALPDLVYRANEMIGNAYTTREALTLLVVFYLLILVPIALGARYLERRVRDAIVG